MRFNKHFKGPFPKVGQDSHRKISFIEVQEILYECLKNQVENTELLDKCIHNTLKSLKEENLGSWKEYFKFAHPLLKKKITDLYDYQIYREQEWKILVSK